MQWDEVRTFAHDGRTLVTHIARGSDPRQFVLIHGIGVASTYFTRLAAELSRSGTVHVLELPGNGSAPEPPEVMSIEDSAALVAAYISAEGLDRPTVVGHSMGAQIVSDLALQHPGHVPRIVLIGAVVDPSAPTALGQGLRLAHDTLRETPSANRVVLTDYLRTGPRWYLKTLGPMMTYDLARTLPLLHADVLIIRGERDPISRGPWARTMADLAPRSRLVEIPGGAHVVQYTHPEEIAALIVDHARGGHSLPTGAADLG
ncbi:alpha/beta fold hydrolase [Amnibacterium flavum]|uniref:Alpha/beta hydrolase n=1 Tax=Amnibacterium flavum TaxID=2173173 RepID=A0A2V1HMD8_9MICO|nr:alpha/beta hydrolase [Amnibacterium flavum]PVZ93571.1 alpha/beta hydrolase [Amnibacterium flavum]